MKLWLLKPIDSKSGPWDPWYDRYFGFVIRAESEKRARYLASKKCCVINEKDKKEKKAWLNSELTYCIELTSKGEEEIILSDFASG